LQQVPGIGPPTAEKILQMRKFYGAFKSVDDLKAVRGIGPKRMEKMRTYRTAGNPTPGSPETSDAGKILSPSSPACELYWLHKAYAHHEAIHVTASGKNTREKQARRLRHPRRPSVKTADCKDEEAESR
jgi:competence ComEA-like helix-hairpin-helix protein